MLTRQKRVPSALNISVVSISLILSACQDPQHHPISVAEAKQVAAQFNQMGFVPPPRMIDDVLAILDLQKPNATVLAAKRASADASPPAQLSRNALASFYYDRGVMARFLLRPKQALADIRSARELEPTNAKYIQRLADVLQAYGYPKDSLAQYTILLQQVDRSRDDNAYGHSALLHASLGNYDQALIDLEQMNKLFSPQRLNNPTWGNISSTLRLISTAGVEFLMGRYNEAEQHYLAARPLVNAVIRDWSSINDVASELDIYREIRVDLDRNLALVHQAKGDLVRAEAELRNALRTGLTDFSATRQSFSASLPGSPG